MFDFFDVEELIEINKAVGESGRVLKQGELESCFASAMYEEDALASLCSIVRSIIQNHPFMDGNKRTGCFTLRSGCELLGYNLDARTNEEWVDFVVRCATERWTPKQIKAWVQKP